MKNAFYERNPKYDDNIMLLSDEEQRITYREFWNYAQKIGEIVPKRSFVFLFAGNTVGSVMGYVAFLHNSIVPALIDQKIDQELAVQLIEVYRPQYIYISEAQKERFNGYMSIYKAYGYCLLKAEKTEAVQMDEQLALMLTTSGSTGSPKMVRQSYRNIVSNSNAIAEYLEIDEDERPITTLPMHYTYGLSIINSHILKGATVLLTEKSVMQKEFWNFFRSEEATSFGGVPYTYEILDKLRFYKMDLPSLRTMTQAGGKLSPELHKKLAQYALENDKHFVVMYGQCEATARMAYLPYDKALEKCGSMGIAIPGGRFSLICEDGQEITEAGCTGELVYEGENVTLGYAQCRADLAKGDERHGRLFTGDMAQRDADGYYTIVGRKKRFLKIYGSRVNLDEMERLVKNQFDYIDCACAGVDDHLYIFITDQKLEKDVILHVTQKTGINHAAINVCVLEEIPKNSAGKIMYGQLEKYYI